VSTEPPPPSARLDPAEHARIFREEILLDLATLRPCEAPLVVLLGGQPGIGKSSSKSRLIRRMDASGGVLDFSADMFRPYHPGFPRLQAGDERALAALDADIDQDARGWVDLAVDYAIAHRVHAVVDSNLANPHRAAGFIERFAAAGYRVEVLFVAGPAALSRLGVLQRYQEQIDDSGRGAYCPVPIQERNYAGVLDTADLLDHAVLADRVTVHRRGAVPLHEQRRSTAGEWTPAPGARQAIQAERERPWAAAEQEWFVTAARTLAARVDDDHVADLHAACLLARPLFAASPADVGLEQLIGDLARRAGSQLQRKWRPVVDDIDGRITADPGWPPLAEAIEQARTIGIDVQERLPQLAATRPLPPERPAAELLYRLIAAHPAVTLPDSPSLPTDSPGSQPASRHQPHPEARSPSPAR
jgi:UDP-N-acetylglucosamine kinase